MLSAALGLTTLACGRNPIELTPVPLPDAATDASPTPGQADAASDLPAIRPPDAPVDGPMNPPPPDVRPPDAPNDRPAMMVDARDIAEARPDLATDPRPPTDAACPVDCSHLPNVQPGVFVECRGGQCIVPAGSCLPGFTHCTFNPNDGCETDLSRANNCGYCGRSCGGFFSECHPYNGSYACGPHCDPPSPDTCGSQCVDLQTDPSNCGTCGTGCFLPNANAQCQQGHCVSTGCSDVSFADCTPDPGCETQLGTDTNCGGCGDRSCTLANTLFTCSNRGSCDAAVCASGFANCSTTSPDCEASFATAPACMPQYLGTSPFATQNLNNTATAIAPDGSILLTGTFNGSVDFDPTTGRDVRTAPNDWDGFITKLNADGSYGWTRVLSGRGDNIGVPSVAVSAGGAVVVTGWYSDTIDLDPSAATDVHFTATPSQTDAFVVKLAADGSYLWGRTFAGSSGAGLSGFGVSIDAAEAVYVVGSFSGEVDFDPGTATDLHTSSVEIGMLVKLTASGTYGWTRTFDNGDCVTRLSSVTVATDGSIWSTGTTGTGATCLRFDQTGEDRYDDIIIVQLGDTGAERGSWLIGSIGADTGNTVTAGRDGSVYVAGVAPGLVDFDPGPGTAMRWGGRYTDSFVLKLTMNGAFAWVRTLQDNVVLSLAGGPDGGVVAVATGSGAIVTRLSADGVGMWTFRLGADQTIVQGVAARGGAFAIVGSNSGGSSADFNPGPDVDPIYGDIVYLSRFRF